MITAVIPAYNEEARIGRVVEEVKKYVDEVLVINDGSTDRTVLVAERAGARVIANTDRKGYIGAIKTGFKEAQGQIVVTLDGDGEHPPEEIPRLIKPILKGEADLVLGKREKISRPSERFMNRLTNFRIKVTDPGTGFRALKRDLAVRLSLKGRCTCGVFVLEATSYGARIVEVPVTLGSVDKKRSIAWHHFRQFFYLLQWLVKLDAKTHHS